MISRSASIMNSARLGVFLDASHIAQAQAETKELKRTDFASSRRLTRKCHGLAQGFSVADENDLTLLGYIAFLDPPKEKRRSRDHRAQ